MLGIITAFGALFLELLVFTFFDLKIGSSYFYLNSLTLALIFSVFLEESVKIIILFQILKKLIEVKAERKQIFFSAIIAGLGFSLTEIFITFSNSQINRYLSFWDILGLLLVHTGTFAILGYALAKKTHWSFRKFICLLPLVFCFHLLYNSLIIYQGHSGFYFLFLIFSLFLIIIFWLDLKRQSNRENLPKSEIGL